MFFSAMYLQKGLTSQQNFDTSDIKIIFEITVVDILIFKHDTTGRDTF